MRLRPLFLLIVLSACGGDDDPAAVDAAPDAPSFDPRLCVPPSNLPDPLVITGQVFSNGSATGVPGATLEVIRNSDAQVIASATADADGTYTLPGIPTGGTAPDVRIRGSAPGFAPTQTWIVDGQVFATHFFYLDTVARHDLASASVGQPWNHANGIVFAIVRSCNGGAPNNGLADASVSVVPGSTTAYIDDGGRIVGSPPTRANGTAIDFNVPAGVARVEVTHEGRRTAKEIEVEAGAANVLFYYP